MIRWIDCVNWPAGLLTARFCSRFGALLCSFMLRFVSSAGALPGSALACEHFERLPHGTKNLHGGFLCILLIVWLLYLRNWVLILMIFSFWAFLLRFCAGKSWAGPFSCLLGLCAGASAGFAPAGMIPLTNCNTSSRCCCADGRQLKVLLVLHALVLLI